MNKWKFCVTSPEDAALAQLVGSMDEGDGWGTGVGYYDGSLGPEGDIFVKGGGFGYGRGYGLPNGRGATHYGSKGDGYSPPEWE